MLKGVNKILTFALWIFIPYFLASLATAYYGIEMGIGVVILTFVALFLKATKMLHAMKKLLKFFLSLTLKFHSTMVKMLAMWK